MRRRAWTSPAGQWVAAAPARWVAAALARWVAAALARWVAAAERPDMLTSLSTVISVQRA